MFLMKIKIVKVVLLCLLCVHTLQAKDEIYFFPKDAQEAKAEVESLIINSNKSITIAMYNFSIKSLAKKLIKASKNGVEVNVFFDAKKAQTKGSEYQFLLASGIKCHLISDAKLHTKIALFDEKIAILGSPNWTKESFKDNHEVLYITSNDKVIQKMKKFIKSLKE